MVLWLIEDEVCSHCIHCTAKRILGQLSDNQCLLHITTWALMPARLSISWLSFMVQVCHCVHEVTSTLIDCASTCARVSVLGLAILAPVSVGAGALASVLVGLGLGRQGWGWRACRNEHRPSGCACTSKHSCAGVWEVPCLAAGNGSAYQTQR